GGGAALGNASNGVALVGGSGSTVGGTAGGAGNVIRSNGGAGVLVDTTTGNSILRNSIFANGGLGIDLVNGGNAAQPAPAVTSVTTASGTTTIKGTLGGSAPS